MPITDSLPCQQAYFRMLVRAGGTEPMVRVMVEASQQHMAETVAATLADAITARLG